MRWCVVFRTSRAFSSSNGSAAFGGDRKTHYGSFVNCADSLRSNHICWPPRRQVYDIPGLRSWRASGAPSGFLRQHAGLVWTEFSLELYYCYFRLGGEEMLGIL